MKSSMLSLLAISLLTFSCKNNQSKDASVKTIAKDSANPQQSFFPVPDYIGGQLKILDSMQYPLSKSVKLNGHPEKLDMSSINELRSYAQDFLHPDISDTTIKKFYTETSIADQSVPSVTLIYTTANNALPIQKINVYIKPNPVENDKVTGIYVEKVFTKSDTVFNQKLYWKTGKNLQVITEKQINGKTLPAEQIKITWDPE